MIMIPLILLELERETGIEPATNSLEGCDSTIELLPRVDSIILSGLAAGIKSEKVSDAERELIFL